MVIWNYKGAVTVESNCESMQPISTLSNARRWSKEAKGYINVPKPAMIECYSSSMGGTDQMDQSIASNLPFIRNCKWY